MLDLESIFEAHGSFYISKGLVWAGELIQDMNAFSMLGMEVKFGGGRYRIKGIEHYPVIEPYHKGAKVGFLLEPI